MLCGLSVVQDVSDACDFSVTQGVSSLSVAQGESAGPWPQRRRVSGACGLGVAQESALSAGSPPLTFLPLRRGELHGGRLVVGSSRLRLVVLPGDRQSSGRRALGGRRGRRGRRA